MAGISVLSNIVSGRNSVRPLLCSVGKFCHLNNPQTRTFLFSKEKEIDRDFIAQLQNPPEISIEAFKRRAKKIKEENIRESQRFIDLRYKVLGPDLSTAHFVIARGGAVKLVGHDKWYVKDEEGKVPLPGRRKPNMFLEAIDVTGMNLMFHGLENFKNLEHLQYLNLSDCPNIDDWCLDRLVWFRRSLVYLDISRCPKVTERGLSALHKLQQLRRLHMSGMTGIQHKPLVAILLEETLPNCLVEGIDYTDRTELDQIQSVSELDIVTLLKGLPSSSEQNELQNTQDLTETSKMSSKV